MADVIRVGDEFTVHGKGGRGRRVDTFRREPNDPAPMFPCERMRVTHLTCSFAPKMTPYTFGAEPEWFTQRGLMAEEDSGG